MPRLRGEESRDLGQADEPGLGWRLELCPAARMLLRPEEIHARSEKRRAATRRAEAPVEMAHQPRWVDPEEPTVLHLQHHGLAAVETRRLDAHWGPGKEPRYGGRLEAALGEPFLLATHGHAILRGKVVERRERRDVVRLRMEPADGVGLHHRVQELPAILDADAESLGQLGVVERAAALDDGPHQPVERAVHEPWIRHGRPSFAPGQAGSRPTISLNRPKPM